MDLKIDVSTLITAEDMDVLKRVLECDTEEALLEALQKITRAALSEYLEMLLGKQVPNTAEEMKQRRLFHLLKHYFRNRLPSEAEISSMFQITASASRTLLRHTRTKYRFELQEELLNTVRSILKSARLINGAYRVAIPSDNILEELKTTVAIQAPQLEQISKVKNSAGVYNIPEDTFDVLCDYYGVSLSEDEAAVTSRQVV